MDGPLTGRAGPVEPLRESAPLAWREAPQRCYRDASGESCVAYHRVWQYLRLLGIISSVRTNTAFLIDALARAAAEGKRRVLIAGTADYSMLAHVVHACARVPAAPDVTVLDRCGTALWLNRWYAERQAVPVATACSDVLAFRTAEPFDVITTHNFLGRFERDDRARLIASWAALLRPGGVVITTQRIRPGGESSRYTSEDAHALAGRVEQAAREFVGPLGIAPADLAREVDAYARQKGGIPIRSVDEVTRALEASGFAIDLADTGGGEPERRIDRPSSPAGPDTFRMRLVARRL